MFHRLVDKQEEPQQQQREQQHLHHHHHHRLGSHRLYQLFIAKQVSAIVQK